MIDIPVLIVGGGPVGLTLSVMLSKLGVRSLLINARTHTTTHPKLDVVNCRSMEVLRQYGLDAAVRSAGNPRHANQFVAIAAAASGPFYAVMSDRHPIYLSADRANALSRGCEDGRLPLETMQRIAQMNLEPVLLDAARAESNAQVEFGWNLYGFEQDEIGVTAMIQKPGERHRLVRSQYLIGCDGPASRVRNFLNIDYDGTRDLIGELFIVHFRSDRVANLYPNREPYWHTWLARPRFSGLLVSPDASRNDFVLHRPFAPRAGQSLESVVDAALGTELPYEIVQSGPWRPQFLVANSFGRGRVFIAGDATHQYMPTGGLGMNTGLLEAHNLAWKLSACLAGWGGRSLMASYEAERLPVARGNRDHVKGNAAAVFEPQFEMRADILEAAPSGVAARNDLARIFVEKVSRLYESMGIELGYRYADSPIVIGEVHHPTAEDAGRYIPTTAAGARLPNAWCADGQSVLDQLDMHGFTLLNASGEPDDATAMVQVASARRIPLKILHLPEPHLARMYQRRWILVRPDQHVAWRGDSLPDNPLATLDTVRGAQ